MVQAVDGVRDELVFLGANKELDTATGGTIFDPLGDKREKLAQSLRDRYDGNTHRVASVLCGCSIWASS
jgi:hypothetical protein